MKPSEWIIQEAGKKPVRHGQAEEMDYVLAIMKYLDEQAERSASHESSVSH